MILSCDSKYSCFFVYRNVWAVLFLKSYWGVALDSVSHKGKDWVLSFSFQSQPGPQQLVCLLFLIHAVSVCERGVGKRLARLTEAEARNHAALCSTETGERPWREAECSREVWKGFLEEAGWEKTQRWQYGGEVGNRPGMFGSQGIRNECFGRAAA